MGFSSNIAGLKIIHDSTPMDVCLPPGGERGLMLPLSRMESDDYHYDGVATPFPASLLIPESEWEARIKEKEDRKTRKRDLIDQAGLPHKDQDRTKFCWINAPTHAVEGTRVIQNQEMVILSPAWAGGIIKNFRNVGGWGLEGLKFLSEVGTVPVSVSPANAIDSRSDTPANRAIAKKYRVQEWWELRPRNLQEMVSLLLGTDCLGAAGLNWWSHEVTYYDVLWLDRAIAILARNSWKAYGDNGYFVLQGSKMMADDLVAPCNAMAA